MNEPTNLHSAKAGTMKSQISNLIPETRNQWPTMMMACLPQAPAGPQDSFLFDGQLWIEKMSHA
jgi:hypothetical protein